MADKPDGNGSQGKGRDYWLKYIDDHAVSLEEGMKHVVTNGAKISTGYAGASPLAFYDHIGEFVLKHDIRDVMVAAALLTKPFGFLYGGIDKSKDSVITMYKKFKAAEETRRRIRYLDGFMSPVTATRIPFIGRRSLYEAGYTSLYPYHFYQIEYFHDPLDGSGWATGCVAQVSLPDENGYCSFGPGCDAVQSIAKRILSRGGIKIMAIVNPNTPRTYGSPDDDNAVRCDDPNITAIVKDDTPLAAIPVDKHVEPARMNIAERAAELVPNGAFIQIGIGDISARTCESLMKKGWHGGEYSEMLPEGLLKLLENGNIERTFIQRGADREYVEGKANCTFAMGLQGSDFYKRLDYNRNVIFTPAKRLVVPEGFVNCWGINNSLSIDFNIQLTAECRGNNQYSGPGGLPAIANGLGRGPDGGSIICLPSTFRKGKKRMSTIVPTFEPGTNVTVPRHDLLGMMHRRCYIVTEHGVAQLAGKTIDGAIRELVAVADPEFRPWLKKQAWKRLRVVFPK
ncbi:MAG TPA: acetyl-CoA hydrolase/transferase C-terminal domain-containing protein [Candidatus Brocadiia bacterium]|nr:acetyl-CoA hydrolase/transferase C-terminal domain-containing protein [Candidatus Brocadiia bacterium]